MSIHSADFPNLILKEGVSFKSKIRDLQKLFPRGKLEEVGYGIEVFEVGINDRLNASFQMGYDGEVISITIERP